ncbi:hypothetical protein PDJAM_G00236900 [Pangasius djambal]|uniref:Uncharacterized protein n=1 Tax=Pangasius djambal TaxID=1691987 RepID=A0ACC5YFW2_9TELE|nr:hypothetical protein [Pangasius djambal]
MQERHEPVLGLGDSVLKRSEMGRWAWHLSVVFLSLTLIGHHVVSANRCAANKATSCSACLQTGFGCAYCPDEKLVNYFPIAELGVLTDDSSNILNIIKKAFESIRSKISIQAENKPKAIGAQILSASGIASDFGNFSIKPGEIGKFKVLLNAKTSVNDKPVCSLNSNDRGGMIRVKPTTFSSAFEIHTSVLCETCDCERNPIVKAARCSGNGDLVCGTCHCYDKWLGPYCNCSSQSSSGTGGCVAPGTTEPCNGRGDCLCGTCLCYNPNQYEGQFCQVQGRPASRLFSVLGRGGGMNFP